MPGSPLGYLTMLQDPSGPLPSVGPAFALALTQGAGKGIATIRDPTPRLNSKAFVWATLGVSPFDLYLKTMLLRCAQSGNGTYIETARSAVGADRYTPLGWTGALCCGAVGVFTWDEYGSLFVFPDAADTTTVSKLVYSRSTSHVVTPDGADFGYVWGPLLDEWTGGGTAFAGRFNGFRQQGRTYQFIGHGYGGAVAHLFAVFNAATFGFAPSLVTQIGSGPSGAASYQSAAKQLNTTICYDFEDVIAGMPLGNLVQVRVGGAIPTARYRRPQGRVLFLGYKGFYISNRTDTFRSDIDRSSALAILIPALRDNPPSKHRLSNYASQLWSYLTAEQKAYNFIYDLHAIEGALTAAGF